jgi:hypothetical protein
MMQLRRFARPTLDHRRLSLIEFCGRAELPWGQMKAAGLIALGDRQLCCPDLATTFRCIYNSIIQIVNFPASDPFSHA